MIVLEIIVQNIGGACDVTLCFFLKKKEGRRERGRKEGRKEKKRQFTKSYVSCDSSSVKKKKIVY